MTSMKCSLNGLNYLLYPFKIDVNTFEEKFFFWNCELKEKKEIKNGQTLKTISSADLT